MPRNTQLYVAFASLLVAISNGLDRAYWFSLFDVDITEDNKADEDHHLNPPGLLQLRDYLDLSWDEYAALLSECELGLVKEPAIQMTKKYASNL
jgi:hypothetical protein